MKHHSNHPPKNSRPWRTASLALALGIGLTAGSTFASNLRGWQPDINLEIKPVGTYATGIFGESAAEIPAYDPLTRRLFVTNASEKRVDVLNIRDPKNPSKVFSIDVSRFGGPNSVAVRNGVVAIAVENGISKQDNGFILLYSVTGVFLNALEAGALPDMITFTPDGRWILSANEGEPNSDYTNDPEGSVTAAPFIGGNFVPPWLSVWKAMNIRQKHVKQIGFTKFNHSKLDDSIRIFGPGATVAQDLEPEYIAVSPDSKTAWVTCQENNAVAVIDLRTCRVEKLIGLGFKDHHALTTLGLHNFDFTNLPKLGTTAAGQDIQLGGFSGLFFEGVDSATGNYKFITHPDRGPNAEPVDDATLGTVRPFPLPDFQSQWVRFTLNPATGELAVTETVGLTDADGLALTGLPNLAGKDEVPVDAFGNVLPLDPLGADLEGIVQAPDGTSWMVDEYRPAIYHFDSTGKLIRRYVPAGFETSVQDLGAIPAIIGKRRANRGFEGVAYQGGKVYAFVQSPLENPDKTTRASDWMRIIEFDPATETTTGMFLYPRDTNVGTGSDKIGDAVASAVPGEFFVLERDDIIGAAAVKNIHRIQINAGTDLMEIDETVLPMTIEQMTPAELAILGIKPVSKQLIVNLAAAGYDRVDKPEGLALINQNTLAVINDNDFGLAGGVDFSTGLIEFLANPQPVRLTLIDLKSNSLDASDKDKAVNFATWPVKGMFQPDSIAAFQVGRDTFYITANEGDAREYIAEDADGNEVIGLVEEARVKDLKLDPTAFPNANALQKNENLGRLTVTTANGDTDGDGDFDELYAFGARSFSIWNSDGGLVFDSGDMLEKITALTDLENFNSTNDENDTFDNRSDNKGPEPEGLAIGKVFGRTFAFIGLERVGGVMVFDISKPEAPRFVQYLNNRDFSGDAELGTAKDLGPEGLVFIPWWESPTWKPLLVVANEVSGTTTVYEIAVLPALAN
jgi:hypothetical protein